MAKFYVSARADVALPKKAEACGMVAEIYRPDKRTAEYSFYDDEETLMAKIIVEMDCYGMFNIFAMLETGPTDEDDLDLWNLEEGELLENFNIAVEYIDNKLKAYLRE